MYADLHNDFFTSGNDFSLIQQDYESYAKYIVFAVYSGGRSCADIIEAAKKIKRLDGDKAFLAFEDIGFVNDKNIDEVLALKPCYVSFTWNYENDYGYGSYIDKPLKDAAFPLIKRLNYEDIAVDTAHISEKGFYQLIENCDRVLNSHTCFYGAHAHIRNIKDEQIKLLIEKKGVIGLTFVGDFLAGGRAKIDDIIKHIDYYTAKFGSENLAIGTDFYGTDNLPDEIDSYRSLGILRERLIKLGYRNTVLNDLFYKNIEKFFFRRK